MTKIALLVNIIAPYRIPIYRYLAKQYHARIFAAGREKNRGAWNEVYRCMEGISTKTSLGFTLVLPKRTKGGVFDYRHIHITPGYICDLVMYRPDAVISSEMGFRSLMALLYGKVFRKPVWVWWGGTMHTERSIGPLKRLIRRLFVRWVPRWISYGETSTEYLMHLGVPRERILQIQNCVDEGLYQKPVPAALSVVPRPVLLYVGQMIERKGVRLLLEAAKRLQDHGHVFSLVLVGEGPEKAKLQDLVLSLGLRNIHFHPAQPPEELPGIYRSADCLVFPTLEDVWGLVVNEALWAGLPVISSVYAGCTREILPIENWFDPLDPNDFDQALRTALEGRARPSNISKLLPSATVAAMISDDIRNVLSRDIQ